MPAKKIKTPPAGESGGRFRKKGTNENTQKVEATATQIGDILFRLKLLEEKVRYLEGYIEDNKMAIRSAWMNVPFGMVQK